MRAEEHLAEAMVHVRSAADLLSAAHRAAQQSGDVAGEDAAADALVTLGLLRNDLWAVVRRLVMRATPHQQDDCA